MIAPRIIMFFYSVSKPADTNIPQPDDAKSVPFHYLPDLQGGNRYLHKPIVHFRTKLSGFKVTGKAVG